MRCLRGPPPVGQPAQARPCRTRRRPDRRPEGVSGSSRPPWHRPFSCRKASASAVCWHIYLSRGPSSSISSQSWDDTRGAEKRKNEAPVRPVLPDPRAHRTCSRDRCRERSPGQVAGAWSSSPSMSSASGRMGSSSIIEAGRRRIDWKHLSAEAVMEGISRREAPMRVGVGQNQKRLMSRKMPGRPQSATCSIRRGLVHLLIALLDALADLLGGLLGDVSVEGHADG